MAFFFAPGDCDFSGWLVSKKKVARTPMKNVNVKTALFISAVLLFRIVFFNTFIIPSATAQEANGIIKQHFSIVMKRKANFETADNSENSEYSFAELREQENGEDNEFKSNPYFLIQVVYSLFVNELTNKLKGLPFYNYLSYPSSHRYLTLQVFRT
jgi:hypothetical protein